MVTPTTAAGRALLELLVKANVTVGNATAHVERIEAEAAAQERERLRGLLVESLEVWVNPVEWIDAILAEPSANCPTCGWTHTPEQGHVVDGGHV